MKFPHYVVMLLAALCAAAPFLIEAMPAKYAAIAPALLAVLAALKVNAMQPAPAPEEPK